jgi:hypothetical protein
MIKIYIAIDDLLLQEIGIIARGENRDSDLLY